MKRINFSAVFKAILKGEVLLRFDFAKYFVHIIYVFFLMASIIWVSLKTESTMSRAERNRKEIYELKIANAQKKFDLERASRRSGVASALKAMGSAIGEPENQASTLKK